MLLSKLMETVSSEFVDHATSRGSSDPFAMVIMSVGLDGKIDISRDRLYTAQQLLDSYRDGHTNMTVAFDEEFMEELRSTKVLCSDEGCQLGELHDVDGCGMLSDLSHFAMAMCLFQAALERIHSPSLRRDLVMELMRIGLPHVNGSSLDDENS